MTAFERAVAAVDAANAADPNVVMVRGMAQPLALAHGRLAQEWVEQLAEPPGASVAVRLAARAHHLRRWEVPRSSYPEGRAAYLKWRTDQKARHARDLEVLLGEAGIDAVTVARVQSLVRREHLATDPETKLVEDAACLVFLETQFAEVADRLDHAKLIDVVRKTARKMTPRGLAAAGSIPLGAREQALLVEALSPPGATSGTE